MPRKLSTEAKVKIGVQLSRTSRSGDDENDMASGYFTGLRPTARAYPGISRAEYTRPLCPKSRELRKKRVEKGQDVRNARSTQTYSFLPASWTGNTHEETDFLPISDREEKGE